MTVSRVGSITREKGAATANRCTHKFYQQAIRVFSICAWECCGLTPNAYPGAFAYHRDFAPLRHAPH